jgi:hypothetical protein
MEPTDHDRLHTSPTLAFPGSRECIPHLPILFFLDLHFFPSVPNTFAGEQFRLQSRTVSLVHEE